MASKSFTKNNGAAKQVLLLCAPFLLFAVAVALLTVFLFQLVVSSSPIWQAFTNAPTTEEGEYIDDAMAAYSPKTVQVDNETFYDKNDFPGIPWGKKWSTLSISYLGADSVSIYNGESPETLARGVVHSLNSTYPGQGGNCVLCFHVNRQKELYYLEDLPVGELITLQTIYGKYVYRVDKKVLFESNDKTYLKQTDEEKLTIYTCYPKEGPYRKQRIAVISSLVKEQSDPVWR